MSNTSEGRIAVRPRPMHTLHGARLVGPTGARTERRISSFSAIFVGWEQYTRMDGYSSPKSALPWKTEAHHRWNCNIWIPGTALQL